MPRFSKLCYLIGFLSSTAFLLACGKDAEVSTTPLAVEEAIQLLPEPDGGFSENALAPTTTTASTSTSTIDTAVTPLSPSTTRPRQPTTTTTTAVPESPPETYVEPPAPVEPEGCMRHGEKSREEAHACWDGLIGQYDWETDIAFAVMMCESRGNPWADNPRSSANGLMQILGGPFDPAANMALAYSMWSDRGWQPWSACR